MNNANSDICVRYKKRNVEVQLVTEVYCNIAHYILTVDNSVTSTRDNFKNFKDAFDSFKNIVETIEKGENMS